MPHPGGILQLVSVPIWISPADTPEILGTLSIGFSLDRRAAARFRLLTNSEIAFGVGSTIEASTLPASGWRTLEPLLAHDGLSKQVILDNNNYIAVTVPLSSDVDTDGPQRVALGKTPTAAKAIILRSRSDRLAFLRPLHTSMFVIAGIAVLAATVLSYGIARTVTRPLGVITATMREMAATGDLTRKIPVAATPHWEDEDARLLASTFNTMTDSISRFQREAAQRERLSSLGRLSTVVAHEIRNPLMIIKAALRGLRRDDLAPADVKTAVADIDEEIVRLNRIVSEVLDFARPIRFDCARPISTRCAPTRSRRAAPDGEPLAAAVRFDRALPAVVTDAERLRSGARQSADQRAPCRRGRGKAAATRPTRITLDDRAMRRGRVGDRGPRPRHRHQRREPAAHLRPVFHDPPHRHRPRPGHLPQHRRGPARHHRASTAAPGRAPPSGSELPVAQVMSVARLGPARRRRDENSQRAGLGGARRRPRRRRDHQPARSAAPARRSGSFDVLVVDNLMPELSGLDVIRELARRATPPSCRRS